MSDWARSSPGLVTRPGVIGWPALRFAAVITPASCPTRVAASAQIGGAGSAPGIEERARQVLSALLKSFQALGGCAGGGVVADRLALGRDADLVEGEELLQPDAPIALIEAGHLRDGHDP